MDFSYSDEQQMLQDSVQKFVKGRYDFDTRKKLIESDRGFSDEYWNLFAELGWLTVPFREEDGGFGGSAVDLMVVMEEFGKGMVVEPFLATAVLSGSLISELGSDAQKQDMLGAIMEGKLQLATAYAEADSRYNLASVATTASKSGDGYVISGDKIVVFNGPAADKLLVVARTSGDKFDRDGISVFLVDAGAAGVSTRAYTAVDGHRAAEIHLKDVKVAADALLGAEGKALAALEVVIDRVTLAVSAEAVGALVSLLQKTVEYTKTRKQFGVAIGTFQALQHRMADMFVECELARSIVIMAAMKLDSAASAAEKTKAVAAAKSRVGRAMHLVGQEAVQIHGGIAVTDELDVGHYFKRVTTIEHQFGDTDYQTMRYAAL
ncbi:acyl-CoA dehydrogenase family protein [Pseudohongiella sp.]|uniref:Pimeloyl-CoA dehydrogenase small subunit n=1 Tax=marine sediment metagenome TaxID=412755 RepID=A0A0F9WIZ6_9ZZZZ|nr:acyl-CoA dehydrogenase family protein [Pseudohongiella sp.]HDZ07649.1 pimeloyl-CoA dehydrogenase small subunit [Pseudohongiella sp.]HEA63229.1 pimeloyl-CoA dehydrogenase small subunit [Pseudohongiella sp.]